MITHLGLAHILVYGCGGMGGVGGMITYLELAHILVWWDGWGGWDDNVPWTCTHTSLRMWWMGGVGGMITYLGLAHILVWWDGWGGWGDNVPLDLLCLSQVGNL